MSVNAIFTVSAAGLVFAHHRFVERVVPVFLVRDGRCRFLTNLVCIKKHRLKKFTTDYDKDVSQNTSLVHLKTGNKVFVPFSGNDFSLVHRTS